MIIVEVSTSTTTTSRLQLPVARGISFDIFSSLINLHKLIVSVVTTRKKLAQWPDELMFVVAREAAQLPRRRWSKQQSH